MDRFSRDFPEQARAADQVMAFLLNYTADRRAEGVTLNQFLCDYRDRLKFVPAVIAALHLLEDERLIVLVTTRGHGNWLDSIMIYPPTGMDIPPTDELLHHDEKHSVRKYQDHEDVVHIKFYKTPAGKFFVWPFVGQVRKYGDSYKHFSLRRHFDDVNAARDCALNQGRMLSELGFLQQC
jgi:hypothetical protein